MKLSALINILTDALTANGDMDVVGMVDGGKIAAYIEVNCPDKDSLCTLNCMRSSMTLSDVINVVPPNETVTVYDYTTGEILIDRNSILYEFSKIEHLEVCYIEVGKCYGDLIIDVRENK